MENKNVSVAIIAVTSVLIGGLVVYFWMKHQAALDELSQLKSNEERALNVASEDEESGGDASENLIGGQTDEHGCLTPAGYSWCPSQQKCMRVWEEYCEEYKDQYKAETDEGTAELIGQKAPGDAGENPPAESVDWPKYESAEHDFHFQYPDKYKIIVDNYGWPYAVVHLISKAGGQSYDITFEVWDEEDAAEREGRTGQTIPYFAMMEHPETGEFVSITCWNYGTEQDCEDIYRTLSFQ